MLLTMNTKSNGTSEPRIVRKYPGIAWQRVWTNVHTTGISDRITLTWYPAINEIIPTNKRLAAIHITTTTSCVRCRATDTLLHRLIACEEGPVIWTWTNTRIAATLRKHPTHTRGIDPTPYIPSLAPPKAGGDNMDRGSSCSIPSPDTATPLPYRQHGLLVTSPLERVTPSTLDTHCTKIPECAIISLISLSAPDSIENRQKVTIWHHTTRRVTSPTPSRNHHG